MTDQEIDKHIELVMRPVTRAMMWRVKQIIEACAGAPMLTLQQAVTDWATGHLPQGADYMAKIKEEMAELESAPSDPAEMADVLLALMLHASEHGIDLLEAAQNKFEVVKTRKYAMVGGRCHHVAA